MVFFINTDITIYKHYAENKIDKYKRIYIPQANWQTKHNSTLSDKGVIIKDSTLVFIDTIDTVLDYGDIIVKGKCDLDITKKSELKDYNTITVMSYIPYPTHIEIEGV